MAIEIADIDELSSLFGKIYWIETQLELSSQWEAYMVTKGEKYRDILFRISHDSETHKTLLKRISSNIEGLDLDAATEKMKGKEFDFKRLQDEEIMAEILKYELLVMDLYKKVCSLTSGDFIEKIWKADAPMDYFKHLKWLIAQENIHINLLRPYAGKIERIY